MPSDQEVEITMSESIAPQCLSCGKHRVLVVVVDIQTVGGARELRDEKRVFGVDGIVKDRWNLKCTACTKTRHRAHGAPIQCTKGKCPKAFHVSCARDGGGSGIVYTILREVEKEVVLLDNQASASDPTPEPVSSATPTMAAVPIDPALMGDQPMDVDPSYAPDAAAPSVDGPLTSSSTASVPQPHIGAQPQPHQASPTPQVLKLIKKTEVEVLCHQHNPVSGHVVVDIGACAERLGLIL
ncbi:hypothetical protein NUW54_g9828 [Trametes sanguinea]|uniref:Uncharacterized protein n=1 Tax=Trametes sanguinea TaxID=158606 RepID=A0ACC1P4J7_9APHY|nr:hypothetical protein NUW54_g9828 [Trametes sanguinea]